MTLSTLGSHRHRKQSRVCREWGSRQGAVELRAAKAKEAGSSFMGRENVPTAKTLGLQEVPVMMVVQLGTHCKPLSPMV